ncbi:hypothetical protein Sjap_015732 [Stephania japonica]|uniref:Uncharacterized protein n=1 Tax=Stephania japonica TaxID=461633 RepID=A0AAP0NT38_9MAGN
MQTQRKEFLKMCDYLSKMEDLTDGLSLAGELMNDDDFISNTLIGLDVKYLFITTVLHRQLNLD